MKPSRLALALLALAAITLPLSISAIGSAAKQPKPPKYKVLVVTAGDRKTDLNLAAVKALREIGGDNGARPAQTANFTVELAQNADQINDRFTAKQLEKYRAVIFVDTGPSDLLNAAQKQAFEVYFHAGGGFLGIGSAVQSSPGWQFFTDILGTRAGTTLAAAAAAGDANLKVDSVGGLVAGGTLTVDSGANAEQVTVQTVGTAGAGGTGLTLTAPLTRAHALGASVPLSVAGLQSATVKVADRVHDATKQLPFYWDRSDTWFNFTSNVRGVSHVLATVVEDPFGPQPQGQVLDGIDGGTMGADHPVSWCKDYKGGRSFYSALGNTADSFSEVNFRLHLEGAIDWTAGVADPAYSDCGATVLANYQQVKISGPPNLSEPIGFDQLPDGRVIQTDRRGGVRLHDPTTGTSQVLATIPVYTQSEDGLYGPGIDPNFSTNKWVYLYYAPPNVDNITYSDGTDGHTNFFDAASGRSNQAGPTQAVNISDYDSWIGYFQLSRFKFVDDAPGNPAHLDLASEQQIMRVTVNRGACCHVAGDLDWDTHGILWLVTGDDSAAGSGDAGNWGQSIDQRTDENQTVRVANATGGTFTLTFNGQTTAPIPFNATAAQVAAALGALANIGAANIQATGGPVNTANVLVTWKGIFEEVNVATLTSDSTGLTGTTPTTTIGVGTGAGGNNTSARQGGLWRMPAADSARSALNTNDLRGKILRIKVKDGDIAPAEANHANLGSGGSYTIPDGNMFPLVAGVPQPKTRPEVYAMGFRNPFRIQVDANDVAYVSDYSPDSRAPQQFHGASGTGRFEIVRHPANYGWPYCFKPDLPEYPWNVNLQVPMNLTDHQPVPAGQTPQPYPCDAPTMPNNDYWNVNGGPSVQPGLTTIPGLTAPDIWYSYNDNAGTPLGTPCFAGYGPDALTLPPVPGSTTPCPRLFPELFTNGVGPHGIAKYEYDPANPNPLKFPPYYDGSIILGEFTQDTMRELKIDEQNRVFKINSFMPCGAANVANSPFMFECDNPMDLQWGADGDFYLLTYGDGFFNINQDAGMYKWQYVKGTREPKAVLTTDRTDGPLPLTVQFTGDASSDPDPGDSIHFDWDFGDGTEHSIDPNPLHTYTARGRYTAVLTVTDSSGKTNAQSTVITAGNTSPTVVVNTPVAGGTFDFGNDIPFTVTVTDPEDGAIVCSQVQVTFVLGHDTHGHAEGGTTGCSGVLHTDAGDVSHGGNVFGVVSATYTDHGVNHDNVQTLTTTAQKQIRQKHQEVEVVVNQSGTNTAANTDGPPPGSPGMHRGSLAAGDWIQLNGPFNLQNITGITFRIADAAAGRTLGTPLAAIEIHADSLTGPIVGTYNLTSTGGTAAWFSQTSPISLSGTHELFLVFRQVTGGATGNNVFNLNWVEFVGPGIGT